jgi:hypothetical protein
MLVELALGELVAGIELVEVASAWAGCESSVTRPALP